ncbi:MAG: hypothetical protein M3529_02255 [Actinomycetota bacterium]|nr:hypothetical protein [Actinomycetota bacterium]
MSRFGSSPVPGAAGEEFSHAEFEAALAARRELGPDYEAALVESFADKIDQTVAERSNAAVREQQASSGWDTEGFVIALVSLGVSVPVTALAASISDLPGLIVAWTGLVGINVANAWGRRRARKR